MNEQLKPHFIDLLFEEYKLSSFIWKMMSFGVNMERVDVKNYDIVLDMIGFPADNTLEFNMRDVDYDNPPENFFCRDWLDNTFADMAMELNDNREIVLSENGLQIKEGDDEAIVKQAISDHIDWLFAEYKNLG
ncbi:hypothetical protein [Mucilaginibacter sp.]|jgi:hypothetical protein|uniref:hypothetical protein n=1 Tax=Mucilaginibacter sp. TaxID=1882438 RepID=UPI002620088C|nr:hypothetical protein [Mucilaginibacter sp.]MDB4926758.1 hypothetical protein [Mucilaginibacter sp.]